MDKMKTAPPQAAPHFAQWPSNQSDKAQGDPEVLAPIRKVTIGVLLFPGFQLLDVAGPGDAFAEVRVLTGGSGQYEIVTVGSTRRAITSSSGIGLTPDRNIFDPCPHFDTLIVPGGLGVFELLEDHTILDWLRAQYENCRRVAAICNGVFLLGAAGLINDKVVTTHWMDATRLASTFRRAQVERDRIFVKDGPLYTTAGVTAGIDLSLALIEEDFGRQLAGDVAKYLVVYLRRGGGQSQFSPLLENEEPDGSLARSVHGWLQADLSLNYSLKMLAEKANMSVRNFTRAFKREAGMTPLAFINDARIDHARSFLENTDVPLTEIASKCGFGSAENFRRVFARRLDLTPVEYRQRFRSSANSVAISPAECAG
jgi:transcriptional regulator GlxA family with amidase domain